MSDTKDIKQILSRIDGMVGSWREADMVSRLERDIVLAQLRDLYQAIADCGESAPTVCQGQPSVDMEPYSGVGIDIEEIAAEPEPPLLQEEPVVVKKADRSAIMSLYCDQAILDLPTDEQEDTCVEVAAADIPAPEVGGGREEERPEAAAIETHGTKVLGDILGSGDRRVADTLGAGSGKTDVASKIVAQQTLDLRTSIGVNDRFLLIRDLFDSNAMAYDSTINRLEEFDDLNRALLYIYENHNWDPNSEAVKLLMDLLTRKLS